ncbi:MAG: MFS transporter [Betaproteobacteria bacterium]|nr:MFS transporter [Betaproteobacteria bacterium]
MPRAVIVLGLVSFCNDVASDIVIPLIPILLVSVLAAGPLVLGLIEGIADAIASFLRLWAGRESDRRTGRRKPMMVVGYALSNVARPLLGLAGSWMAVLILRSMDRVGKGIRSAPRDALIADIAPPGLRGKAFGLHRAFDNAGAVMGGLLAALALYAFESSLQAMILLSAVPGAVCLALLILGVRQPLPDSAPGLARLPLLRWGALSRPLRRYLMLLGFFTFARISETFIVLRGYQLGMSVIELLLLWSALNAAKASSSLVGGVLSDHFGRRSVLLISWLALSAAFYLLCRAQSSFALWWVTIAFGVVTGMSEGAERALIGDLGNATEQGTAFGWYHFIVGLAAIPAGALFGALWQFQSAAIAYSFAGAVAALAVLGLAFWAQPGKT